MRILIVDDDADFSEGLETLLSRKGHSCVRATSGRSALAALNAPGAFVDVVLSDWMMPDGTGLELLSALRKSKKLRTVPFVLMSGMVTKDELLSTLREDPDAIVLKPFSTEVLLGKLDEAIDTRVRKEFKRANR